MLLYRYIWVESDEPTNEYFYETSRRGRKHRVYLRRQREYTELAPVIEEQEYFESEPARKEYIEKKRKKSAPKPKPKKTVTVKKKKSTVQKKRPPTKKRPVLVKEKRKPTAKRKAVRKEVLRPAKKVVKGVASESFEKYLADKKSDISEFYGVSQNKIFVKQSPLVTKAFETGYLGNERSAEERFNMVRIWYLYIWGINGGETEKTIGVAYHDLRVYEEGREKKESLQILESKIQEYYEGVKVMKSTGRLAVIDFLGFEVYNRF